MRIELDFGGDANEAMRATEILVKALERIQAKAVTTERALEGVELDSGEAAKTVANARIIERALEGVERQAKQTERALDDLHTPVTRVPTPDGRQFAWAGGPASMGDANALSYVRGVNAEWREVDKTLLNVKYRFDDIARSQRNYDVRYDWLTGGGSRGVVVQESLRRAGSGGGGGGGGRRRSGLGDDDGRFQLGDLTRGILPGGQRESVGATFLLGGLGLATGSAAAPGIAGILAAIPALASTAGASIATLAIGLGGLGDAIDGDKEAFDKLTPRTQEFVQEVRSFIPFLKEVQELTREGLFPGLTRGLNNVLSPEMVKTIKQSAGLLGGAVGGAAGDFGTFLGSGDRPEKILELSQQMAGYIDQLTDAGINWTDTLLDITVAGGPFTDWLLLTNEGLSESVNAWVDSKIASGEFGDAMESAKESLTLVADVLAEFIGFVVELGQALGPAGRDILTGLADALEELADTVEDNQEQITEFAQGAVAALRDVIEGTWPVVEDLAGALNSVAEAVGGWEDAFKIILLGTLAAKVLDLARSFGILIGVGAAGSGAAGTAAGIAGAALWGERLLKALRAMTVIGAIAITIDLIINEEDRAALYGLLKRIPDVVKGPAGMVAEKILGDSLSDDLKGVGGGDFPSGAGKGSTGQGVGGAGGGGNTGGFVSPLSKGTFTGGGPGGPSDHASRNPRGSKWYNNNAVDLMAPGGTTVFAVEDGIVGAVTIRQSTGTGWNDGSTVFLNGDSGTVYAYLHLSPNVAVKRGQRVRAGQVIGSVGHGTAGGDHLHFASSRGNPSDIVQGRSPDTTTPSPAATDPPGWDPDKASKTANTNYELPLALRRRIARAAITATTSDDIAAYKAAIAKVKADLPKLSGEKEVDALQDLKSLMTTLANFQKGKAGASKGSILAQILRIDEAQEDMADWDAVVAKYGAGLQKLENALRKAVKAGMTPEALDAIRDAISRQIDDIRDAIRKEEELARKREDMWRDHAKKVLDAFDEAARSWVSPTQQILDQMASAYDDQQAERAIRDAEERVADARKRLEEAMSGRTGDANPILDQVRGIVSRYDIARQLENAQLGVLGGGAGSNWGSIITELQGVLGQTLAGAVDADAVKDAQRALRDAEENLQDARYRQTVRQLQKKADAEKDAHEKEITAQRTALEQRLAEWGEFWVKFGTMMDMTIGDFWNFVTLGSGPGATVGAYTGQTTAQVAASQGMTEAQWIALTQQSDFEPNFGHVFAAGGPITRPTLLVDAATRRTYGTAGERGMEWLTPMGGDGASVGGVTLVFENGMEWLRDFVRVEAVGALPEMSYAMGVESDRRRRGGRY